MEQLQERLRLAVEVPPSSRNRLPRSHDSRRDSSLPSTEAGCRAQSPRVGESPKHRELAVEEIVDAFCSSSPHVAPRTRDPDRGAGLCCGARSNPEMCEAILALATISLAHIQRNTLRRPPRLILEPAILSLQ